ncbi:MAG: lytic transglycosylase domain-containing protein [Clostridiales bacterium]|nr:lytic transglycosylase domain-containing protein [Clostridiales bacterium]
MKKSVRYAIAAITAFMFAVVIIPAVSLCMIFPNKYASNIAEAADEFDLPRSLVKSVVWAESRFDPKATSNKGAKGLMQIMPDTFKECVAALGLPRDSDVYDVNTSLRCGCYYLSLLIDKFDGDTTAALMAYNAGEVNARKFLDGAEVFPETQGYLKSINKAQKIYGLFG